MSVRKRAWTTSKGEKKEAWLVDYTDQNGDRHIQTFDRKKDADEYHATVRVDVGKGIHTPHSKEQNRRRSGGRLDQVRGVGKARAIHARSLSQPRR